MVDLRTSSQIAAQRFVCGGHCFWRMPTKEEIECYLTTTEPPTQQIEFLGTVDEALAAGWRMAPRKKRFHYMGTYYPLYLCPDCVEKDAEVSYG